MDDQNFRGRSSADPGHTATLMSLSLGHTKTPEPSLVSATNHWHVGYAPRSSHGAKDIGSAVLWFEIEGEWAIFEKNEIIIILVLRTEYREGELIELYGVRSRTLDNGSEDSVPLILESRLGVPEEWLATLSET